MKKNRAAVTLGRRGGLKGGTARAARLTPEQRRASASKAVRARWAKAGKVTEETAPQAKELRESSDETLLSLLARLRASSDLREIRVLSEQIERVVFHKQFESA